MCCSVYIMYCYSSCTILVRFVVIVKLYTYHCINIIRLCMRHLYLGVSDSPNIDTVGVSYAGESFMHIGKNVRGVIHA